MLFDIPNELIPYVRVSKESGLVHSQDMPEELLSLFNKTKVELENSQADRKKDLLNLLVDDEADMCNNN